MRTLMLTIVTFAVLMTIVAGVYHHKPPSQMERD
jgi:hypothetical protein